MGTQFESNPETAANAIKTAQPGDVTTVIRDEVNAAHDHFKDDPKAYRQYMDSVKNSVSNSSHPQWLQELQIIDRNVTANDVLNDAKSSDGKPTRGDTAAQLQALTSNNDELYKLLDTYKDKKGEGTYTGDGSGADGQVGKQDIDAFLADAANSNSKAAKYLQEHGGSAALLEKLAKRDQTVSADSLLGDLNYGSREDFDKVYSVNSSRNVPVDYGNPSPDSMVSKDGTSRGFHYDMSGNIDAINKTNPDGSTQQYRKLPGGEWVDGQGKPAGFAAPSFDENGNYNYYTPNKDPNKVTKTTVSPSGETTTSEVALKNPDGSPATDASGKPIIIPGVNARDNIGYKSEDRYGNLDVTGAQGSAGNDGRTTHAEYTIAEGNTLTQISRDALGLKPGDADPANLPEVIAYIAQANGYGDPNLIPAGAQLKIPADLVAKK